MEVPSPHPPPNPHRWDPPGHPTASGCRGVRASLPFSQTVVICLLPHSNYTKHSLLTAQQLFIKKQGNVLSPPYTYLTVWLWQCSGSRLAWGNKVCYQPLPAGTGTNLPQHTPGKTNSVPQRWWCSDINLRAKWAASSDTAGCPPRRGEKIPKLLRVPSTAAPSAQGWDQQLQIKVGSFFGFFSCFTWSPILMRGHDNHSSGLANIKPVKSI